MQETPHYRFKQNLYEWCRRQSKYPNYEVKEITDHHYIAEVRISGLDFVGVGDSNSKKRAIINSALDICHKLVRAGLMNSNEVLKSDNNIREDVTTSNNHSEDDAEVEVNNQIPLDPDKHVYFKNIKNGQAKIIIEILNKDFSPEPDHVYKTDENSFIEIDGNFKNKLAETCKHFSLEPVLDYDEETSISLVPPVVKDKLFENIAPEPKATIKWCPPIAQWNPWLFATIEEGPISKASLEEMSEDLYLMFVDRFKNEKECQRRIIGRSNLEIYKQREKILQILVTNQVALITGGNKCGKTTQIPQYILETYIDSEMGAFCNLVVTKRNTADAISAAEKVSYDKYDNIGSTSGFSGQFESNLPRPYGSVLYTTVDTFIRNLENELNGISHVIVDDLEEIDFYTDFLLAVLKDIIETNKELKIVLISKHQNTRDYSLYFGNCPVFNMSSNENVSENSFSATSNNQEYKLERVILYIKLLKLGDIRSFLAKLIEPPSLKDINEAEKRLTDINALNLNGDITAFGKMLARLPIDFKLARMLILGSIFSIGDLMCKMVAICLCEDPFKEKSKCLELISKEICAIYFSDQIATLYAYEQWLDAQFIDEIKENEISDKYFIYKTKMRMIFNTYNQLKNILTKFNYPYHSFERIKINFNAPNPLLNLSISLLSNALQSNLCLIEDGNCYIHHLASKTKAKIDRRSHVCNLVSIPSKYLVFNRKVEDNLPKISDLTQITPLEILAFAGKRVDTIVDSADTVLIDRWLTIKIETDVASLIVSLRNAIDILLAKFTLNPRDISSSNKSINMLKECYFMLSERIKKPSINPGDSEFGQTEMKLSLNKEPSIIRNVVLKTSEKRSMETSEENSIEFNHNNQVSAKKIKINRNINQDSNNHKISFQKNKINKKFKRIESIGTSEQNSIFNIKERLNPVRNIVASKEKVFSKKVEFRKNIAPTAPFEQDSDEANRESVFTRLSFTTRKLRENSYPCNKNSIRDRLSFDNFHLNGYREANNNYEDIECYKQSFIKYYQNYQINPSHAANNYTSFENPNYTSFDNDDDYSNDS